MAAGWADEREIYHMDIFDYAIQMEKDGEDYYRDLAAKNSDRGIASILTLLADAEARHRRFLEIMQRLSSPEVDSTTIVSDVKNIFSQMKENQKDISIDVSQVELYRKAQGLERKSQKFYLDKAAEVSDTVQKEILYIFADEENQHYLILQNLIDFISRPDPGNWLENAEWHNLDEY